MRNNLFLFARNGRFMSRNRYEYTLYQYNNNYKLSRFTRLSLMPND